MQVNARELFRHVSAEKSSLYRAIMDAFAVAKRGFRLHLRPDEVIAEGQWNGSPPALEDIQLASAQLTGWGNLESQPDTARVANISDFYRACFLYRLSQGGEAVESALVVFVQALRRRAEFQTVPLGSTILTGSTIRNTPMPTFEVMSSPQRREACLPHFVNTRLGDGPWEPPFLFCDHHHSTYAEAEVCHDFGRANDTTDYEVAAMSSMRMPPALRYSSLCSAAEAAIRPGRKPDVLLCPRDIPDDRHYLAGTTKKIDHGQPTSPASSAQV